MPVYLHLHLSLNRGDRWGTTDDFTTSFLLFSLFSTTLWDLANSRPVHSPLLSSRLFSVYLVFFPLSLCLARWFWPDVMNGKHDHTTAICVSLWWAIGLREVQLPAGSWHRLPRWQHCLYMKWVIAKTLYTRSLVLSWGSTSFPWLVFFFGALLWGSMIHKHTGRWMWQESLSVISWNGEKCCCHSKLVWTLLMLLSSVLSWRVSQAWNPRQL